MGNCLKTQLKEAVQNSNLEVLNKLILNFDGTGGESITVLRVSESTSVSSSGFTFSVGALGEYNVNKLTLPSGREYGIVVPSASTGTLTIDNKYNIMLLHCGNGYICSPNNIDTLRYNDIYSLDVKNNAFRGDLSKLVFPNLSFFEFMNSEISGSMDSIINNMQNYKSGVIDIKLQGTNIDFNITTFAANKEKFTEVTLLTVYKFTGDFSELAKTNVEIISAQVASFDSGKTIEQFIAKAIDTANGGRGAGTMQLDNGQLYNITYNGSSVLPSYRFSWDAQGSITWG